MTSLRLLKGFSFDTDGKSLDKPERLLVTDAQVTARRSRRVGLASGGRAALPLLPTMSQGPAQNKMGSPLHVVKVPHSPGSTRHDTAQRTLMSPTGYGRTSVELLGREDEDYTDLHSPSPPPTPQPPPRTKLSSAPTPLSVFTFM